MADAETVEERAVRRHPIVFRAGGKLDLLAEEVLHPAELARGVVARGGGMAVEIAAHPTAGVDRPSQGRHERRVLPLHDVKRGHHRVMFRAVADDDVIAPRRNLLEKPAIVAVAEVFHRRVTAVGAEIGICVPRPTVDWWPAPKLHLARDRPPVDSADRGHDEAGPRELCFDVDSIGVPRQPLLFDGPAPHRRDRHPPLRRRGRERRHEPAVVVGPSRPILFLTIKERHARPGHRSGSIDSADRRGGERDAGPGRRGGPENDEGTSGKYPADQVDRGSRRQVHRRCLAEEIAHRIAGATRRGERIGVERRSHRLDSVGLAKPFVIPPDNIGCFVSAGGKRPIGPNPIDRLDRERRRMRIGIAGGDGEEIIAVGERIGRLDTRRLRGLCGDDAKRHARTVDGERCGNHSFHGHHFAAAQARRSSEGVAELTVAGPVAAELIVGIAHGGQIDDRAADIADGHVGVAGRKSVADHGDDPVVAKNVVAEDPIGFLTGGGSRGACRRRLPQRRRFQQFRRDRDDLCGRSRCHR